MTTKFERLSEANCLSVVTAAFSAKWQQCWTSTERTEPTALSQQVAAHTAFSWKKNKIKCCGGLFPEGISRGEAAPGGGILTELKWIHTRQKARIHIPAKRQFFIIFFTVSPICKYCWKNLWRKRVWDELGFLYLLLCGSRWVFEAECSTFDWFQMCPLKLKVGNHFLVQWGHKMELKLRTLSRYV